MRPDTTCGTPHDYYPIGCLRAPHTSGRHVSKWQDKDLQWETTALTLFDALAARSTDPASSHAAARRDFDIPQSARGLALDILEAVTDEWQTCRQLIERIYGPGPYTYDEAVGLNKVQTVALKLHRQGYLDRRDPDGGQLQYRRRSSMGPDPHDSDPDAVTPGGSP